MLSFLQNYPFILAFILGLIPALIWMWFWLKEDSHPEPAKMITLSFLGGMLAVLVVLPLEKLVYNYQPDPHLLSFILWATIEETAKFAFVYFIALRNKKVADEPVDDMIYLIVSALGFVTFENALFLIPSIHAGNLVDTIVSGNLRFVGASLLHIMSSATIGVYMALAFYKSHVDKVFYTIAGVIVAIVLHTGFNLLIINSAEKNIFLTFGVVWVGIVAILLMFEKIKNINQNTYERQ
ncbi:MAG TPA: PrsW family glutamic-type intramembrane protease [Candidatus Paceibacterota bacterium]